MTGITLIIILAILIFVHELGHFLMAKKSGIRVDEFALGFPPKILSKKIGETEYCLNLVPLGGYVKIHGENGDPENNTEIDPKRTFSNQSNPIKIAVLSAGVLGNIVFAFIALSIGFMFGLPAGNADIFDNRIENKRVIIQEILTKSPAENAGLKAGDEILNIENNSTKIEKEKLSIETIKKVINESSGEIKIDIQREEKILNFEILPESQNNEKKVGMAMSEFGNLKLPFYLAPIAGIKATYLMTKETIFGISGLLKDTVLLKADWSSVSGPVGIAGMVGKAKAEGFGYLIVLVSLISVNLAVINLIPIPALDGGRILFVLIESIIKRPIKTEIMQIVNTVGFLLLMILMRVDTEISWR
jgi:regulator of sigma E protease